MYSGIPSTPTQQASGNVTIFFSNGTRLDFASCTDIVESVDTPERQTLTFTHGGRKFVFRKVAVAGWAY